MQKSRKTAIYIAISICLVASIALAARLHKDEPEAAQPKGPQIVSVATAPVTAADVPLAIDATGSFVGEESSNVAPSAPGRVAAVNVDVGAFVQKCDILAKLDDRDARLQLQQAQAQFQQAEASVRQAESRIGIDQGGAFNATNVPEVRAARAAWESAQAQARQAQVDAQRYADLVRTGDVSLSNYEKLRMQAETAEAQANSAREQYDAALNTARQSYQSVASASATVSGARAQLGLAQKALADTTIRAPFSGYVTARPVSPGEWVTASSTIATVVRIQPLKLELQVPEGTAGKLRAGMPVTARVAAFAGRDFSGEIRAINPAIDPQSRAITVEALFPNEDLALKPGMFASARVILDGVEHAIYVPRQAVVADPDTDSSHVYVVEEGVARLRVVRPGAPDDQRVRILSGVSEGDVVITNPAEVFDGAPVRTATN